MAFRYLLLSFLLMKSAVLTSEKQIVFKKIPGILHLSPHSEPNITCSETSCSLFRCANACAESGQCALFSHSEAEGACVLSDKPETESSSYDSLQASWDTYEIARVTASPTAAAIMFCPKFRVAIVSLHLLLNFGIIIPSSADKARSRMFRAQPGILHQSPYSEPEVTCPGLPCTKKHCARACLATETCVLFSHNPKNGACVLSGRLDTDNTTYDVTSSSWNTYVQDCPADKGYTEYGSRYPPLCLKLVTEPRVYQDADSYCRQDGAKLARVKTMDVYNIAKQIMIDANCPDKVLIGANDIDVEQAFYWNDGTPLLLNDPMWYSASEGRNADEDCVAIKTAKTFVDCPCDIPLWFMCQYDI
ncbi:hypothetical protein BaRGS_00017618 [Batillaria attramentaria]|uniref:C-type lectin domain-containing protein n=1 Tax=Batillaria attramentaria TaxID=370345 RepID=A0ABD0KVW7_9CAEN